MNRKKKTNSTVEKKNHLIMRFFKFSNVKKNHSFLSLSLCNLHKTIDHNRTERKRKREKPTNKSFVSSSAWFLVSQQINAFIFDQNDYHMKEIHFFCEIHFSTLLCLRRWFAEKKFICYLYSRIIHTYTFPKWIPNV